MKQKPRHRLLSRLFLLLLLSLTASCAPQNREEAEKQVLSFLNALAHGDEASLKAVAPDFSLDTAAQREEIAALVGQFPRREIRTLQISGKRGRALVDLSSDTRNLQFDIPLIRQQGRWFIGKELSFVQTIDIIPAQKD